MWASTIAAPGGAGSRKAPSHARLKNLIQESALLRELSSPVAAGRIFPLVCSAEARVGGDGGAGDNRYGSRLQPPLLPGRARNGSPQSSDFKELIRSVIRSRSIQRVLLLEHLTILFGSDLWWRR